MWNAVRSNGFQWLPEKGFGWYPVQDCPYDENYWNRYRSMDRTAVGAALTKLRCDLVDSLGSTDVVDVGVGGGRFVEESSARGYDVNPAAIEWLKNSGRWCDVYAESFETATFWDSLEHIHDPRPLLANVENYVVVSLPIFKDCTDVLRSKHFRKDEHCWYFTAGGFENFMGEQGFILLERNDMEQSVGREQIETFVFQRWGHV